MNRLAIALLVVVLAGFGCGPMMPVEPIANDSGRVMAPETFPTGSWTLSTVTRSNQQPEDVSTIGATLTLSADGQLSARMCNSMSGAYTIENGTLKAPQVMSTLMFCEGTPGEIEATFSQDLSAGFQVEGSNNALTLRGMSGTAFAFERSGTAAEPEGEQSTASGTVSSVDLEHIAVDGPAVIEVKTTAGTTVKVIVPSFGLGMCEAKEHIADVFALKVGDSVEVRGSVTEEGAIMPCESSEHYLRVVAK